MTTEDDDDDDDGGGGERRVDGRASQWVATKATKTAAAILTTFVGACWMMMERRWKASRVAIQSVFDRWFGIGRLVNGWRVVVKS